MTDKAAGITSLSIERVLEELQTRGMLDDIDQICFWSDGAPHFVSRRSWTWYATRCLKKFKKSVLVRVGVPNHLKGDVDRLFRAINHFLEEAARSIVINSVGIACKI